MDQPPIAALRQALAVRPGKAAGLAARPTRHRQFFADKKDARTSLEVDAAAINALQDMLYASGGRALLLVLQGLDTAGKSGTIRRVFADTSPLGLQVHAFKAPSRTELAYDYLWRVHQVVPPKGYIGIFDRSHYEDVLVVKVRGLAPPETVEQRYDQINAFEALLADTGTTVLKCMLHFSRETQGERLKERITEPHKRWKFNAADLEDRARWDDYMAAYETALTRCSTRAAPWYVIPSDSRTRRNGLVARLVRGALEDMALDWPARPELRLEDHDFS